MSLAPIFIIPAMTGQDGLAPTLDQQLESTLQSIEYLGGLRSSVQTGDVSSLRALKRATEDPRDATPQRSAHLASLTDDIAKLRYSLDRLMEDPREVAAIASMPPSVLRALGLSGATRQTETPSVNPTGMPVMAQGTPSIGQVGPTTTETLVDPLTGIPLSTEAIAAVPPHLAGRSRTTGLSGAMHGDIASDIAPLDHVSPSSRRRGDETVPIEGDDYIADPMRLGRLLVRAHRPAEAVEILEQHSDDTGARYWLGRAYQDLERTQEALVVFRALVLEAESSTDKVVGTYARHAAKDLEFLEFKLALMARRTNRSSR